jgi:hypothetical protein
MIKIYLVKYNIIFDIINIGGSVCHQRRQYIEIYYNEYIMLTNDDDKLTDYRDKSQLIYENKKMKYLLPQYNYEDNVICSWNFAKNVNKTFFGEKSAYFAILNNDTYNILCVNSKLNDILHYCLLIDEFDSYDFILKLPIETKNTEIHERITKYYKEKKKFIFHITNPLFSFLVQEILKNLENVKNLQIGIILCDDNQTREECFKNRGNIDYFEFINMFGDITSFKYWCGYKASMYATDCALYLHWRGILPIVCHDTTKLCTDDQRRLIGNNIFVVIYIKKGKINSELLNDLGEMPHLIALVKKIGIDEYLLDFLTNGEFENIYIPKKSVDKTIAREIILINAYNARYQLNKINTKLKKMFASPQKDYVNNIVIASFEQKNNLSTTNKKKRLSMRCAQK